MKALFVTGTDTGVGKTVVVGCLAAFLRARGFSVITQKWIQTGCRSFEDSDAAAHIKKTGIPAKDARALRKHIMPYCFSEAVSPHLAARNKKTKIDAARLKKAFHFLAKRFDVVIVEGTGGALVPLDERRTLLDVACQLNLPVLLVAANRLGGINHALLSVEVLKGRGLRLLGVIFNNFQKQKRRVLEDNPRIVRQMGRVRVFGTLPRLPSGSALSRAFGSMAEKIAGEIL